jgi:hypothetical protein
MKEQGSPGSVCSSATVWLLEELTYREAPNIEMPRVLQLAPASGKSRVFLRDTRLDAHGSLEKTVEARRARPSFRPPANICSIKIRRALTGVRLLVHYADVEDTGLG